MTYRPLTASEQLAREKLIADERVSPEELADIRQQLRVGLDLPSNLEDVRDGLVPNSIGRFEIQDELGRGSYGTVYVAYDPKMFRNVAVKIAHADTRWDDFKRTKFFAEAHAAARLGHPNVVTVHEYGEEAGLLYIVYQLCIGPTLDKWMAERPDRVEPRVAVEIVRQLAHGLSHAHARGIVHRDVKPSNVVLQEADDATRLPKDCPISFEPRLTDFGLAHDVLSFSERMGSYGLIGTIDYMSPEQVQGDEASASPTSDIYALGVLMYRLLTGVLPSQGTNTLEVLKHICSTEPVPPRIIHPGVPQDLAAVCMHCLSKKPRDRYQHCEALIEDLDNWEMGAAVSVRPRSLIETAFRNVRAAPVVSTLTLAVVMVCLLSGAALSAMVATLRVTNAEQARLLAIAEQRKQHAAELLATTESANRSLERQIVESNRQFRLRLEASYRSDICLAYREYNAGRVLSASDILDGIDISVRPYFEPGFDFSLLRARLAEGTYRLTPHSNAANDVQAVPGTNLIASCGDDGRILFQDVTTGYIEHSHFAGKDWHAHAIAIDAQANQMAVGWTLDTPFGEGISAVKVYRFDRSNSDNWLAVETHQYTAPTTIQSLSFSPDGRRLAIGPRYKPVSLRDLDSDTQLAIQTSSRNKSVEFSPDGAYLLVLAKDDRIMLIDTETGQEAGRIAVESPQTAGWSPDGQWIAVTCFDSEEVCLYSTDTMEMQGRAAQLAGVIESFCFDTSGRRLIASTRTGSIAVWDLKQLDGRGAIEPVQQVTPHSGLVMSLEFIETFVPDGRRYVASVDDLGNVLATPLDDIHLPAAEEDHAVRLVVAPHRQISTNDQTVSEFLAGYSDGSLRQIDRYGSPLKTLLNEYRSEATVIATSKDGRLAAMGWLDGRVAVIELFADGNLVARDCGYPTPEDSLDERGINSLQFSEDGKFLAACGDDARVRVWDVANCDRPLWEKQKTSIANCVCFVSPTQLACGGMFEEIAIHDVADGRMCAQLPSTSRTRSTMLDKSRGVLLSGHDDGRVRIHDIQEWKLQETLGESVEAITSLGLSPNGKCYLAGDAAGTLRLWDSQSRLFIGSLCCFRDQRQMDTIDYCPTQMLVLLKSAGDLAIDNITALAK